MATPIYIQNLEARRSAIADELAALDATKAGGKPNAGGPAGGTDHVGYKDGLYRELREIEEMIRSYYETEAVKDNANQPWEIRERVD
jgi:hypothetical protein